MATDKAAQFQAEMIGQAKAFDISLCGVIASDCELRAHSNSRGTERTEGEIILRARAALLESMGNKCLRESAKIRATIHGIEG